MSISKPNGPFIPQPPTSPQTGQKRPSVQNTLQPLKTTDQTTNTDPSELFPATATPPSDSSLTLPARSALNFARMNQPALPTIDHQKTLQDNLNTAKQELDDARAKYNKCFSEFIKYTSAVAPFQPFIMMKEQELSKQRDAEIAMAHGKLAETSTTSFDELLTSCETAVAAANSKLERSKHDLRQIANEVASEKSGYPDGIRITTEKLRRQLYIVFERKPLELLAM